MESNKFEAYKCLRKIKAILSNAKLLIQSEADFSSEDVAELNSLGELSVCAGAYYEESKDYQFARDLNQIDRTPIFDLCNKYTLSQQTSKSILDCERELLDIINNAGYYYEYNESTLSQISGNILFCKNEIQEDWRKYIESMGDYSDPEKRKFDISLVNEMYQNIVGIRGYLYRICREIRSGDPVIPEFENLVGAYVDFYNFWDDKYSMLNHVDWKILYTPIKETIEAISSFLPDKDWGDIQCDIFERAKAVKAEEVSVQQKSNPISLKVEQFKNNLIQTPEYRAAYNRGLIVEPFAWTGKKVDLARWLSPLVPQLPSGGCDWSHVDNIFTINDKIITSKDLAKTLSKTDRKQLDW